MNNKNLFKIQFLIITISTTCLASEVSLTESFEAHFIKTKRTENFDKSTTSLKITEPVLIQSASKVPTLFIPVSQDETIEFKMMSLEDQYKNYEFSQANHKISDIVFEIIQIQDLIRIKKISEADNKITEVQKTYPKLHFILFLKASVEYLKGEKENSLSIVIEALKYHPEYKPGLEFKNELERVLNRTSNKKEAS